MNVLLVYYKGYITGSFLSSIDFLKTAHHLKIPTKLLCIRQEKKAIIQWDEYLLPPGSFIEVHDCVASIQEIIKELPRCNIIASSHRAIKLAKNLADTLNSKYSVIVRGGTINSQKELSDEDKYLLKGAKNIACVAMHLCEFLERSLNLKTVLLRHPPKCKDLVMPRRFDSTLKLLYIGQLVERKSPETLLEVLKYFKQKTSIEVSMTIIGQGPKRDRIIKEVSDVTKELSFFENLQPWEVDEIFARNNFLVSFSRNEGRPRVVLEAIAHGLIPILSSIPAHKEILGKHNSDLLFTDQEILPACKTISANFMSYLVFRDKVKTLQEKSVLDTMEEFCLGVGEFLRAN